MRGTGNCDYRSEQYYLHDDPPSIEVLATTIFSGDHDPVVVDLKRQGSVLLGPSDSPHLVRSSLNSQFSGQPIAARRHSDTTIRPLNFSHHAPAIAVDEYGLQN